jgi:hypothetical protein
MYYESELLLNAVEIENVKRSLERNILRPEIFTLENTNISLQSGDFQYIPEFVLKTNNLEKVMDEKETVLETDNSTPEPNLG